jgi:hypothetical protein
VHISVVTGINTTQLQSFFQAVVVSLSLSLSLSLHILNGGDIPSFSALRSVLLSIVTVKRRKRPPEMEGNRIYLTASRRQPTRVVFEFGGWKRGISLSP